MPKILQAPDLGARPSLRTNRQVVTDRSGEIEAQGLQVLAKTVSAIAQGMLVREDKLSYASAKSSFLTSDIDARRVIEVHDDYETWEELYREKAKAALEKAMEKIKSKPDRKLFEMDVKLAIERGAMAVRGAALKRRIDDQRAGVDEDLDKLRGAALDPKTDPGTRSDILGNALDNLESARTAGAISDQEAGDKGRAFTRDIVEGSLMTMEPEERIKALKDPKGQAKEFLHEDTRIKMLRAAEKENKDTRDRGAAQSAVDKIMEDNPESRGDALIAARKINDPDVRARAVTGVNARFSEMNAAEAENIKRIVDAAKQAIDESEGHTLAGVPEGDLQQLPIEQKKKLDAYARYVQTGMEPAQKWDKWYDWTKLPDDEKLAMNLDVDLRPVLDNQHYDAAIRDQEALREGKTLTGTDAQDEMLVNALIGAKIFKKIPGARDTGNKKIRYALIDEMVNRRIVEANANTPAEKQAIIDEIIIKRAYIEEWGRDPQLLEFEISPEQKDKVYTPFDEIDLDDLAALREFAELVGRKPSHKTYERAAALWTFGDRGAAMDILENGPQVGRRK